MSHISTDQLRDNFLDWLGEEGQTLSDVLFFPSEEKHYIVVDGEKKFIPDNFEAIL